MRLYYDLHIHSCLSPCGDNDMTPNNLVNMSVLNGLDMIALTDHNSCKNCAAAAAVGEQAGIVVVPGAEITTAEEIHVVSYFPDVTAAMEFDAFIEEHLAPVENVPHIFGDQLILDALDEPVATESRLLINATDISISDLPYIVSEFRGACIPAHVDRDSYSVISVLGTIPDECGFTAVEVSKKGNLSDYTGYQVLQSSDAHYLQDISERIRYIELPEKTPQALIDFIRRGK